MLLENLQELDFERLLGNFPLVDFLEQTRNLKALNLEELSFEELLEKLERLDLPTRLKNLKLAEAHFREAVKINPNCAQASKFVALALYHQDNYQDAVDEARRAKEKNSQLATVRTTLGDCLIEQDKLSDARNEFLKATELNPELAIAYLGFGQVLLAQGQSKQQSTTSRALSNLNYAIIKLKEAIEKNPKKASYHSIQCYVKYQQGILRDREHIKTEALKEAQRAVEEVNPTDADAHYIYGLILSENKEIDKAIAEYQIAIELSPNTADYYQSLGNAYYIQKEYDKAKEEYQKAILIKPTNAGFHYSLAWVLHNQDKLKEAIKHYKIAIEHYGYNPFFYSNLANVLWQQSNQENSKEAREGLLKEAKDNCERAIHLNKENAYNWNLLGCILFGRGNFEESARKHMKAIELEPSDKVYYQNTFSALKKIDGTQELQALLQQVTPLLENIISETIEIEEENTDDYNKD